MYAGQDIGKAFDMVTTVSAVCFVFVWSIILASYLKFRSRRPHLHEASKYKMPGGIPMVWVVFAFFAFVLWALTTQPDTLAGAAGHAGLVHHPRRRLVHPAQAPGPPGPLRDVPAGTRRREGRGRREGTLPLPRQPREALESWKPNTS